MLSYSCPAIVATSQRLIHLHTHNTHKHNVHIADNLMLCIMFSISLPHFHRCDNQPTVLVHLTPFMFMATNHDRRSLAITIIYVQQDLSVDLTSICIAPLFIHLIVVGGYTWQSMF